jgi:DNA-binding transcriptional LysR family regulator
MIKATHRIKDLYRGHPLRISQETQEQVLEMVREGLSDLDIARLHGMHPNRVIAIREFGLVVPLPTNKPERCKCGAMLLCKPCLACQLVGVKQ